METQISRTNISSKDKTFFQSKTKANAKLLEQSQTCNHNIAIIFIPAEIIYKLKIHCNFTCNLQISNETFIAFITKSIAFIRDEFFLIFSAFFKLF